MRATTRLPWHAALTWIVTRDEPFTVYTATLLDAECPSSLAIALQMEMEEAGCFTGQDVMAVGEKVVRLSLATAYQGRFAALAHDYENGGRTLDLSRTVIEHLREVREPPPVLGIFEIGPVREYYPITIMPRGEISVADYIGVRLFHANAELCAAVSEGIIKVHGVELEHGNAKKTARLDAACFASTMRLDFDGTLHQEAPDRRRDSLHYVHTDTPSYKMLTVPWGELARCFPPMRGPTLNQRKHEATRAAIESIGAERLAAMRQKTREQTIIDAVKGTAKLTVSPRFVRDRWLELTDPEASLRTALKVQKPSKALILKSKSTRKRGTAKKLARA